jgi:hypothetical protein
MVLINSTAPLTPDESVRRHNIINRMIQIRNYDQSPLNNNILYDHDDQEEANSSNNNNLNHNNPFSANNTQIDQQSNQKKIGSIDNLLAKILSGPTPKKPSFAQPLTVHSADKPIISGSNSSARFTALSFFSTGKPIKVNSSIRLTGNAQNGARLSAAAPRYKKNIFDEISVEGEKENIDPDTNLAANTQVRAINRPPLIDHPVLSTFPASQSILSASLSAPSTISASKFR